MTVADAVVASVLLAIGFLLVALGINLLVGRWAARELRKLDEENDRALEDYPWQSR